MGTLIDSRWTRCKANDDHMTDSHFQSTIATRVKFYDDKDMCMVPFLTLVYPCFVVYNKNYYGNRNNDRTRYAVNLTSQWTDEFLPLQLLYIFDKLL